MDQSGISHLREMFGRLQRNIPWAHPPVVRKLKCTGVISQAIFLLQETSYFQSIILLQHSILADEKKFSRHINNLVDFLHFGQVSRPLPVFLEVG